jgi:hypothetical protein
MIRMHIDMGLHCSHWLCEPLATADLVQEAPQGVTLCSLQLPTVQYKCSTSVRFLF